MIKYKISFLNRIRMVTAEELGNIIIGLLGSRNKGAAALLRLEEQGYLEVVSKSGIKVVVESVK